MGAGLQFKSIKNRLTFWFLLVALLPFITVSIVSYQRRIEEVKQREFDKIATIRDLKIKQITTWLHERFNDLKALADDPELRSLEDSPDGQPASEAHSSRFASIRQYLKDYVSLHKDYTEAFFIGSSGQIEIATNERLEGESRAGNLYFTQPLKTGEIYIKDIFYSLNLNIITMTISMPIHCALHHRGHIIGILVLRINLDHTIYELLSDVSGLGETGETVIFNKELTALSHLRGLPHSALNQKLETREAMLAVQGKTGIITTSDYRAKTVLAAYGYIQVTGWGFVAKQDLEEINAPVNKMLSDFLLTLFIAVILVFLLAVILSRSVARPVLEMIEVSKKIQGGDMDARNTIFSSDEFGFLSESFNRMADSLALQMRVKQADSEIMETLVRGQNITSFASELLKTLMKITDSEMSAFYMLNEKNSRFEHITSIGMMPEIMQYYDPMNHEGEFGAAIATQKISHIKEITEDTAFKFRTFAGTIPPREIVSIPVIVGGMVTAMISLASIRSYSRESLEVFNQPWVLGLNAAFSNLMANEETRRLANELKDINEELESQARMLRAQTKELIRKSDELHDQNIELDLKRREVEEANRLKSQFLSNMSHELRTPLNSIMALSRVLIMQTGGKITEEEASYLRIIERNGKNLLALINDILDLSKIEAGRVTINPRAFSLETTIDTIIENLSPIAAEKGLQLSSKIEEDFPRIETDEERLYQILQNIIGNAVKFTDKGSVTVSAGFDVENFFISVADTGIGIPGDQLGHIFEEFRQVDGSSSRKFEGTGLGLAIALKSARMLGGDISVESIPEEGSTFVLTLPIAWKGEKPIYESRPARPQHGIRTERKTILVVDDDPEAANMISTSLLKEGYNIIAATSGKEAIKLAQRYSPFAITLDILMPDMDGWEVLQTLKNSPDTKDIPVIIVSVTEEEEDKETGFALGAAGYIIKPISSAVLIAEIRKIAGVVKA
ncbi:putative Histidine kinase [uncultured Desulfobacterium sp.]|uniref:histidine kinase n=1 Tax=uncultured Desulfobacterium sp. TaxID=201089 RepID=A0A445MYX2_9BACT|nr:putative Histidine kinase [uncultured Desulfobacterium sp.]